MKSQSKINHVANRLKWGEDTLAFVIFAAMTLLPVLETGARLFNTNGIPASQVLVQHFTLWIGFLGAVLATRQNKLLALTREPLFDEAEKPHLGKWIAKVTTFLVLVALTWGSWELLKVEMQYPIDIAPNIPRWLAQIIMPIGFGLMAVQVYFKSYKKHIHRISLVVVGLLFSISAITDAILIYSRSSGSG